jgi:nucleotide-binding universal stress UspA family protein
MKKTTNILVPIDFSTCSENALAFAVQLADKTNANLQLINVPVFVRSNLETPISASFVIEEKVSQSKNRLLKLIQKVTESVHASLDQAPSIQAHVEMGQVEAAICDLAVRDQVDYIVMGTQGENSTFDKYLGSVASNVLKNAPCPVLIIPENTVFEENLIVGYATDLSGSDTSIIRKVVALFKSFQLEMKCIHFNEKEVDNTSEMEELKSYFSESIPEIKVGFYNLPVQDKVKDMNDFIEKKEINMLVMYKPKRSFFESIFHNSFTRKMSMNTSVPLLVLK